MKTAPMRAPIDRRVKAGCILYSAGVHIETCISSGPEMSISVVSLSSLAPRPRRRVKTYGLIILPRACIRAEGFPITNGIVPGSR